MSFHAPVIYDNAHHKPIDFGDHIRPEVIPVSATPSNLVTVESDGIAVVHTDIISTQPGNDLTLGVDGRVFYQMPEIIPADFVSADKGNDLTLGSDAKLFLDNPTPADFLSNQAENSLGLSAIDQKIYFRKDEPFQWISTQANNNLELGVDARLFVPPINPADLVSTDVGNLITIGTDGGVYAVVPVSVLDTIADLQARLEALEQIVTP